MRLLIRLDEAAEKKRKAGLKKANGAAGNGHDKTINGEAKEVK